MSFRRNPQFVGDLKDEVGRRLMVAAEAVRVRAVSLIEEPKSGIMHRGNVVPSSEPGEPPAGQTGELAESIDTHGPIESEDIVEAHISSDLVKARMLEAGTVSRAPRPFMLPSLVQSRRDIAGAMRGEGVADG